MKKLFFVAVALALIGTIGLSAQQRSRRKASSSTPRWGGLGSTVRPGAGDRGEARRTVLGCKVNYQYSGWQPDVMIAQFKEALAAQPDGITIMGHPGVASFKTFVDDAERRGIIVTRETPRSRSSRMPTRRRASAMSGWISTTAGISWASRWSNTPS